MTTASTTQAPTALSSMTGFSRGQGAAGPYTLAWEIKSVNAKGLDLRLRLPPGWDAIEPDLRKMATSQLQRGTVYATLSAQRMSAQPLVRINEDVLAAVMQVAKNLSERFDAAPPTADGILSVKGVIDIIEPQDDEATRNLTHASAIKLFAAALNDLVAMRGKEGATLGDVLETRLKELERLAHQAESAAARTPGAVRARLAEQVAMLLETSERFDADRLHQEAVLIAAKADIREELDRIASHIAQARDLLRQGGAVGRRLDFLSQEFNREVNTCCSKSNDIELTRTGLDMKNIVEQFREQVQNIE